MVAMNVRATYTAVCERSGRWWAVHVPEVPGVFTQATRLDSAADQARDAIAAFLDVSPDSFDVDVREHLSPTAEHDRVELEVARFVARAAEAHLRAATRTLAHRLVSEDGLSMRDAALINRGVASARCAAR